jgi:hypothetical protein
MGKLTISTGPFPIVMLNYQRVYSIKWIIIQLNLKGYVSLQEGTVPIYFTLSGILMIISQTTMDNFQ